MFHAIKNQNGEFPEAGSLTLARADWPLAGGGAPPAATIRERCEDFRVIEAPLLEPSGEGEHLWVWIRKTDWTTAAVGDCLARWAGVERRGIGWAGRKDRKAVTEQWFSIHLPGRTDPDVDCVWPAGIELLALRRHDRKLRAGMLAGNRFLLRVRHLRGEREEVERRLEKIREEGAPNYFGPQRFGRRGDNMRQACQFLLGGKRIRGRALRSTLISAARSWIFNELLAARVRDGSWRRPVRGDVLMLEGSHSVFRCEAVDETILARAASGDLRVTGPLPGDGGMLSDAPVEREVLQAWDDLVGALAARRVKADRRPLSVTPRDLELRWLDDESFELSFELPPGAYATSILRELVTFEQNI
ncbi:MAG TPA: tRNA pseudouridine(13) synthase TruD [Gammaproteobacteria bacterium]|nr:tRNA pseudouridine(13) synthase TruD [Gammaproteobacteria bacterium]